MGLNPSSLPGSFTASAMPRWDLRIYSNNSTQPADKSAPTRVATVRAGNANSAAAPVPVVLAPRRAENASEEAPPMIKLGLEVSNLPEGQCGRGLPNSNRALLDHVRYYGGSWAEILPGPILNGPFAKPAK